MPEQTEQRQPFQRAARQALPRRLHGEDYRPQQADGDVQSVRAHERDGLVVGIGVGVLRHLVVYRIAAAGLEHPQALRPIHFSQRTSTTEVLTFAKLYPSLRPGELIDGTSDPRFREAWAMARADSLACESE